MQFYSKRLRLTLAYIVAQTYHYRTHFSESCVPFWRLYYHYHSNEMCELIDIPFINACRQIKFSVECWMEKMYCNIVTVIEVIVKIVPSKCGLTDSCGDTVARRFNSNVELHKLHIQYCLFYFKWKKRIASIHLNRLVRKWKNASSDAVECWMILANHTRWNILIHTWTERRHMCLLKTKTVGNVHKST